MISLETILSMFDDKFTLLKWLKKVEKVVKQTTLVDTIITQPTPTTAIIRFIFNDGTHIDSPALNLPRGERGASGEVSVGTVTTLPAGSNATVTNVGTRENAIFNFGIPQGERGATGAATVSVGTVTTLPAGSNATVRNVGTDKDVVLNFGIPRGYTGEVAGLAEIMNNIERFYLNTENQHSSYSNMEFTTNALSYIRTKQGINLPLNTTIKMLIAGSESIVVDIAEDGKTLEFHIDNNILNKVARALLVPIGTVANDSLVGISTSKEQMLIKLGDTLYIDDDTINVNFPASIRQVYRHTLLDGDNEVLAIIECSDSTPLTAGSTINDIQGYGTVIYNAVSPYLSQYQELRYMPILFDGEKHWLMNDNGTFDYNALASYYINVDNVEVI